VHNARLYEEVRSRERWLEAIGEVTSELLGGTGSIDALQLIASRALELTGADQVTGRLIPVAGSTLGDVFADHVPRNVASLGFDFTNGLAVEFGPALALPVGAGEPLSGVLRAGGARRPGTDRQGST
jgi:hypothetical protein